VGEKLRDSNRGCYSNESKIYSQVKYQCKISLNNQYTLKMKDTSVQDDHLGVDIKGRERVKGEVKNG
jgi:hypothetical protein